METKTQSLSRNRNARSWIMFKKCRSWQSASMHTRQQELACASAQRAGAFGPPKAAPKGRTVVAVEKVVEREMVRRGLWLNVSQRLPAGLVERLDIGNGNAQREQHRQVPQAPRKWETSPSRRATRRPSLSRTSPARP